MVLMRNRLAGFLPDVTSKPDSPTPGKDQPFGEFAVGQVKAGVKDFREVSAYSTVYPELAWGADRKSCWRLLLLLQSRSKWK